MDQRQVVVVPHIVPGISVPVAALNRYTMNCISRLLIQAPMLPHLQSAAAPTPALISTFPASITDASSAVLDQKESLRV